MTEAFKQLCSEVQKATVFESSYEKCRPQYQRVLDYLLAHPEERDEIALALGNVVRNTAGMMWCETNGLNCQIYLVQFLMDALKWPEVKIAAEDGYKQGGGPSWHEVKVLLESYK